MMAGSRFVIHFAAVAAFLVLAFAAAVFLFDRESGEVAGDAPAADRDRPSAVDISSSMPDPEEPTPSEELREHPVAPPELGEDTHRVTLRSRTGRLDPSPAEIAARFQAGDRSPFEIATFDGDSVLVSIRDARIRGNGEVPVITGSVKGEPGSLVSIAQSGESAAGSVLIPSRDLVYEIRPEPDGGMRLSEIDVHALGECEHCLQMSGASATTPDQLDQ